MDIGKDSIRSQDTASPSPEGALLERTFLHLPRVGLKTEQAFWQRGLRTWADLEAVRQEPPDLFGPRSNPWLDAIDASRKALDQGDTDYFATKLPPREHYRIAAAFPERTLFLDIETTGLSLYYDTVTVVGCALGARYACHIVGTADDQDSPIAPLVAGAKCVVTFNGTVFDFKFLARHMTDLRLPNAHVDLRYLVRRASMSGGQKDVETALGIQRPSGIQDMGGAEAVLLWYEYISGSVPAGERLVRYNHADVEGMKFILDSATARIATASVCPSAPVPPTNFAGTPSSLRFGSSSTAVYVPPFRALDVAMNYELLTIAIPDDLLVVGIDLTGSEQKPSGWCELRGREAQTRLVDTDDAMVAAIARAKPHLVSIDSPLSLPAGRQRVDDDDPTRERYGIMRQCERTLKRRGINVYPSLIPSMQRLTARGIRLAARLRSLGVPVIESYPGAAQDIMNIPRKGAGVDHLRKGLRLFGIAGDYVDRKVTHDELDAITSAIVGVYFWAGRYEALGNEAEDYLIIPDLRSTVARPRVVGISGPIAAGKTTAARLLQEVGFAYGRYSQVLADMAENRNLPISRKSLQALGQEVHVDPGQRWLNRQLGARLESAGGDIAIDGIRWPEDYAFWVERYGPAYHHVHLQAPSHLRRERYVADGQPAVEFDAASTHEVEGAVSDLETLADFVVPNQTSVDDVRRALGERIDARLLNGMV